ncbi:Putative uncharacterized protein [Moritella viscosa]|uniref:hypothetical protein n=1 Tax=Moritella viscosa TaxID=80854 RepID=UPI000914EFA9|nr:hypothetical protein [Moritella viscosa]SGZ10065.1 Putative uncharacterized protein [Moritella viscosa]
MNNGTVNTLNVDNRSQNFYGYSPRDPNLDIALLCLVGGWDESNKYDTKLIQELVGEHYDRWIERIRTYRDRLEGSLTFDEQKWGVADRKKMWLNSAQYLYDDHIHRIGRFFIKVYTTPDPQFDLEPEKRFAAVIYDKQFPYSNTLKTSLIETLMLIEMHQSYLTNVTKQFSKYFVSNLVEELLATKDWRVWAGIQNELPEIAELVPNIFFRSLSQAIDNQPSLITKLFEQERTDGIANTNYLTGIVWALEVLSWEANSLQRVIVILAKLDSMDPNKNSNWANKPGKVLSTLLWPCKCPAGINKYRASLKAIKRYNPQLAWEVLINLLSKMMAFGIAKPKWRINWVNELERQLSNTEIIQKLDAVSHILVEMADDDNHRLIQLVDSLTDLTPPAFELALALVKDKSVTLSHEVQDELWQQLIRYNDRHRYFSSADWAMSIEEIARIEDIISNIKPSSLYIKHKHLFSMDWRGPNKYEDFNDNEAAINTERCRALREIIKSDGLDSIFKLASLVESSYILASSVSQELTHEEISSSLITALLKQDWAEFSHTALTLLYERHSDFIEKIDSECWKQKDWLKLFLILPANPKLWKDVDHILKEDYRRSYWVEANINHYSARFIYETEAEALYCLHQLIEVSRYSTAVNLTWGLRPRFAKILQDEIIWNLLVNLGTSKNAQDALNVDHQAVLELIENLQESDVLSVVQKAHVEILYSALIFDRYHSQVKAVNLEKRISNEPLYYLEWYQTLISDDITEETDNIKKLAYDIISNVKRAPGVTEDGQFSSNIFSSWLRSATDKAKELNLDLKPMRIWLGQILFYTPRDSNNLWCPDVLEILNAEKNLDLLEAFHQEIFSSRGVRTVDMTGREDFELANQYKELAVLAEQEGFWNIYPILDGASKDFQWEGEAIVNGDLYGHLGIESNKPTE